MLFSPSIAVLEAVVIGLLVGLGTRSARLGALIPVAMAAASGTTSLMKEAIERRRAAETPLQAARRLREKHGIKLSETARFPLPREAFDEMWGEN